MELHIAITAACSWKYNNIRKQNTKCVKRYFNASKLRVHCTSLTNFLRTCKSVRHSLVACKPSQMTFRPEMVRDDFQKYH